METESEQIMETERRSLFHTAIDIAAEQSAARAEGMMEAVLTETLRVLREEFTADITGVKDSMEQLTASVEAQEDFSERVMCIAREAKELAEASDSRQLSVEVESLRGRQGQLKEAAEQLAASIKAQEEICQRLAHQAEQHTEASQLHPAVKAFSSEFQEGPRIQADFVTRDDLERIKDQMSIQSSSTQAAHAQQLNTLCTSLMEVKETLAQQQDMQSQMLQSDCSLRSDVAKSLETMRKIMEAKISEMRGEMEALRKQLSEHSARSTCLTSGDEDVVSKASLPEVNLNAVSDVLDMAQRQAEITEASLLELGVRMQLSKHHVRSNCLTPGDLEVVRKAALSEVYLKAVSNALEKHHEAAIQDHVEERISRLHAHAQESVASELQACSAATKEHVDMRISDLHAHLSQIAADCSKNHLSEMKHQVQKVQDGVKHKLSEMRSQMQEMQNQLGEARRCEATQDGHPALDNNIAASHALMKGLKDKCSEQGGAIALSEIRDLLVSIIELEGVTRADLNDVRAYVRDRVSELEDDIQDLRRLSDDTHPDYDLVPDDVLLQESVRQCVPLGVAAVRNLRNLHVELELKETPRLENCCGIPHHDDGVHPRICL